MNIILVTLWLTSVLNSLLTSAAPAAVSSVHVTFISGNKATHYSHGTGDDGSISHFNSLDNGLLLDLNGDHTVRKRSVTRRPPSDSASGSGSATAFELLKLTNRLTTTQQTAPSSLDNGPLNTVTSPSTSTTTDKSTSSLKRHSTPEKKPFSAISRGRGAAARRVEFIKSGKDEDDHKLSHGNLATNANAKVTSSPHQKQEENVATLATLLSGSATTTFKPKDTKAVKRSPQFNDNFLGSFDFPDFDEFGGNDFGHGEFDEPHDSPPHGPPPHHGGGGGGGGHHPNHEGLAPDGVFLPPVPTQASNYVENDPYLAEPEVANYAVQHVPYFHEFPHKRTVLALNERREENGLEPNLLRSIRPFFAFFEINKRR